jgi:hypothetical protein
MSPAGEDTQMSEHEITEKQVQLIHHKLTLQWVSATGWFATRGYEVWYSNDSGKSWIIKGKLNTGFKSWFSKYPLIAQAGRMGIQNLIQLNSGTVLCVADGVVLRSVDKGTTFLPYFSDFSGSRPLRTGLCQDNFGRIYLGEYFSNRDKDVVRLWRSDDDAVNWFPVYIWPSGEIRHIHFVQYDPYSQKIWLGTGDEDEECRIYNSLDGGVSFHTVGAGTQLWRAGSLLFTSDAIYWGTDIGIDHNDQPNHIMRLDRKTGTIDKIKQIYGPAYYSCQLTSGALVIGSCVEQANHHNDWNVHLLWTKDQDKWYDLRLWPKIMAPKIFGPATISFPLCDSPINYLMFNVNFTKKYNGSLLEIKL